MVKNKKARVNGMQWIKINPENLPKSEILAANFKPGSFGYQEKMLGYLSIALLGHKVICEGNNEVLEDCTHHIDLDLFDIVE